MRGSMSGSFNNGVGFIAWECGKDLRIYIGSLDTGQRV